MNGLLDYARTHWNFAAVVVGMVLVAILVNVIGRGRRLLRRTVILLLLCAVVEVLRFAAASEAGSLEWPRGSRSPPTSSRRSAR